MRNAILTFSIIAKDTVLCSTSVNISEKENTNYDFEIYPNPANDMINISLTYEASIRQIIITDLLGKEYYNKIVNPKNSNIFISLSIENLPLGIYFVNVSNRFKTLIKL
ncbi:MAG: T9SS type A sorting domain-containing protein [Bacteroidetes bacterium]|nr:T9SS type A sorting domain-containing protein [Bacteroidota bacterium]